VDARKKSALIERLTEHVFTKTSILIVGIVTTVITLVGYFQEQSPKIQVEVLSNYNVLDIKADVSKLDILYDSTSLKQKNENLRIITLRIINAGTEAVLKGHYDESDPIGLQVKNGYFIEKPDIIETSNSYLKKNLHLLISTKDQFSFSSFIIEPHEFFILKLVVLHPTDTIPTLTAFGKVAGQKSIKIINAIGTKDKSFLGVAFGGDIWIQVTRWSGYTLLSLIVLIAVAWITRPNQKEVELKLRELSISQFIHQNEGHANDHPILKLYRKYGALKIHMLKEVSDKDDEGILKAYTNSISGYFELTDEEKTNSKFLFTENFEVFKGAIEVGLFVVGIKKMTVNPELKKILDLFTAFLAKESGIGYLQTIDDEGGDTPVHD
jgi:hypothetical protein